SQRMARMAVMARNDGGPGGNVHTSESRRLCSATFWPKSPALTRRTCSARYAGEAGPVPGDIDVLIIGDADDDAVFDTPRAAARLRARGFNVRLVRPEIRIDRSGGGLSAPIRGGREGACRRN